MLRTAPDARERVLPPMVRLRIVCVDCDEEIVDMAEAHEIVYALNELNDEAIRHLDHDMQIRVSAR